MRLELEPRSTQLIFMVLGNFFTGFSVSVTHEAKFSVANTTLKRIYIQMVNKHMKRCSILIVTRKETPSHTYLDALNLED